MKFNKYKISHYFTFFFSGFNYFIAILLKSFMRGKNNNILLFGHKLVGNLEVIFNDTRFSQNNIFFITLNYRDYLRLKKIYGNRILTPLNIFHLFKSLGCRILVASHGIFLHKTIKKLEIKTIYCGHSIHGSIPRNKIKDKKFYETFDEVWLHSPYDKYILTKERTCSPSNLKTFGFARNQIMLENLKDVEAIKANNSLGGKKIILYAPTGDRNNNAYRKSEFSVSNIEFYKYVVNSLLQSNIVLIVKTHLNDSISKDVRNFVKANENILFQDNLKLTNDYDSMVISDVLITDYSTIYVDYLLLEKPIYIISNPDPDPDRVQSSIFKDIKLPKLKNKKDIESMFIKLKDDKLESYNITNLKNNIYENLSHLKTIEKINERLSSDPK